MSSSAAAKRREKRTLLPPRPIITTDDDISYEISLHQLPKTLHNEIALVFPDLAAQNLKDGSGRELLAIPTYHTASMEILERNQTTEDERLRIFLCFKDLATQFRNELSKLDSMSNVDIPDIDGSATFSRSTVTIYDEVSSTRSILGYSTFLYMGVQMVHHPRIGYSKLAIHTMILYGRPDDVKQVFLKVWNNQ